MFMLLLALRYMYHNMSDHEAFEMGQHEGAIAGDERVRSKMSRTVPAPSMLDFGSKCNVMQLV